MMKKYATAMLMACGFLSTSSAPISKSEARLVALSFMEINDTSSDDVPISPYYVFSRGAGKGYIIVSGDDTTTPIIGYTEQGDYDEGNLVEPMQNMLNSWRERISIIQTRHTIGPRRTAAQRIAAARVGVAAFKSNWVDVPALVKTHWHQDAPYNDLAPLKNGKRCMTGCVATAGSQVTYYFHKDNPDTLAYSTPTYSYGTPVTVSLPAGTPIEWDQMKLSGSGTALQNNAVAKLMYALGTSAWLTYGDGDGLATSGHNEKMAEAMRGQFFLDSSHKWKTEYSQQGWETLIYNNLKSKRPMLYSGAHPTNGGHSVVLDGYQTSTGLFHFNFGWGGQGDGWYTVDDETGMNGFNSYQDLVFDITPRYQNLQGTLHVDTLYHRAPNTVKADVTNNGTLDYDGFFIYTNTSNKLPNSYVAKNNNAIEASGKPVDVDFTITPSNQRIKYIFLCNKNKKILDSCMVTIVPTTSALWLNNIHVDAGTETTVVDDISFKMVNNTTARINVTLTNGDGGTYCNPSFKCLLESYNQDKKTWTTINRLSASQVFQEGESHNVLFSFSNLKPGTLYRALLGNEAETSTTDIIRMGTNDSIAYFTVRESDFTVSSNGRHAVMSGLWDATLFQQIASDENICSFDISQVQQISKEQLQAANPNALYYTTTPHAELEGVPNIITNGVCPELMIHSNADFKPSAPFTATHASFVIADAEAGKWKSTLVPFDAKAPYGMQVKKPTSATNSTIAYKYATEVEAMTPAIYLTSHDGLKTIEANNAAISTDTIVYHLDGKLIASTIDIAIEDSWYVLGYYANLLYYMPKGEANESIRFQSVLTSTKQSRVGTSPAADITADLAYYALASTTNKAYQAIETSPQAPQSALEILQAILKQAEDMLSYRSTEDNTDIKTMTSELEKAIADFLETVATGITPTTSYYNGTRETEYFNLSGQRISRPEHGIIIIRQGNITKKQIIR